MVLSQVSPEKWEKFSGKAKWDVLVAMRGPDSYDPYESIKLTTSSVLRHVMGKAIRTGGMINTSLPFVTIPTPNATQRKSGGLLIPDWRFFNGEHFFGHVGEAANYCDVPIWYCPRDLWIRLVPEGNGMHEGLYQNLIEQVKGGVGQVVCATDDTAQAFAKWQKGAQ